MVENLPAFAACVIVAHLTDVNATAGAALFFWKQRLVHAVVHIMGLPYIRTLAFRSQLGRHAHDLLLCALDRKRLRNR